jgi:flagellar basal body-associated protein FliL
MAQKNTKKQKMTNAQREAKMKAAEERQKRADEKKAAKERTKKIFTWIIVIILVIGLTLPVAGLSAAGCMSQNVEDAAIEQVDESASADADASADSTSAEAEASSSSK